MNHDLDAASPVNNDGIPNEHGINTAEVTNQEGGPVNAPVISRESSNKNAETSLHSSKLYPDTTTYLDVPIGDSIVPPSTDEHTDGASQHSPENGGETVLAASAQDDKYNQQQIPSTKNMQVGDFIQDQSNQINQPSLQTEVIADGDEHGTVVKENLSLEMKIIKGCHIVIILAGIPAFGMSIELYLLSVEVSLGVVIMSALCFSGSAWAYYFYNDFLHNMRILICEAICGFIALFCASAAYDTFGTIMACGFTYGDQSYFTKAAYCVKKAGKFSKTCDCTNIYYDCIQFTSTKCYEDCNYCLESVPIRCETVLGFVCVYLFVAFLLSVTLYCGSIWPDLTGRMKNIKWLGSRGNRDYKPTDYENKDIEIVEAEEGGERGEKEGVELFAAKVFPEEDNLMGGDSNNLELNVASKEFHESCDIEANYVVSIEDNNRTFAKIECVEDLESVNHHVGDHNSLLDDDNNSIVTMSMMGSTKLSYIDAEPELAIKHDAIVEGTEEDQTFRDSKTPDDCGQMVSIDDLENISHAVVKDATLDTSNHLDHDDDNATVATIPNIEDVESVKVADEKETMFNADPPLPVNFNLEDDNRSITSISVVEQLEDIHCAESFREDKEEAMPVNDDANARIENDDNPTTADVISDTIPELEANEYKETSNTHSNITAYDCDKIAINAVVDQSTMEAGVLESVQPFSETQQIAETSSAHSSHDEVLPRDINHSTNEVSQSGPNEIATNATAGFEDSSLERTLEENELTANEVIPLNDIGPPDIDDKGNNQLSDKEQSD